MKKNPKTKNLEHKMKFLTIFDENFDFWPKISICDQNFLRLHRLKLEVLTQKFRKNDKMNF